VRHRSPLPLVYIRAVCNVALEGIRGNTKLHVSFHGVRGSTPCPGPDTARYGGNTSCVCLRVDDGQPLILDLGTGLRTLGDAHRSSFDNGGEPLHARALLTHLHWDHVMGLPFFSPMLNPGATLDVYGPNQSDGTSFDVAMREMIKPPMFPVRLSDFPGEFRFHSIGEGQLDLGDFQITARLIPHIGDTLGFRIQHEDVSVAYLPDVQQPVDGSQVVDEAIIELARDVDLMIHDSQYTPQEFAKRSHWGHCTPDFAITTAQKCNAKSLALFHHDPSRTDHDLDHSPYVTHGDGLNVFIAREGMTLSL